MQEWISIREGDDGLVAEYWVDEPQGEEFMRLTLDDWMALQSVKFPPLTRDRKLTTFSYKGRLFATTYDQLVWVLDNCVTTDYLTELLERSYPCKGHSDFAVMDGISGFAAVAHQVEAMTCART